MSTPEVYGAEDLEERKLQNTKYPHLRVATGGKGPPTGPGTFENWLANLPAGCTFVSRERTMKQQLDYNLYHVVFKGLPEMVLLKWELPDGKLLDCYVDPVRFSNRMELGKILGIIEEQEQPAEEVEDGNSDRTD